MLILTWNYNHCGVVANSHMKNNIFKLITKFLFENKRLLTLSVALSIIISIYSMFYFEIVSALWIFEILIEIIFIFVALVIFSVNFFKSFRTGKARFVFLIIFILVSLMFLFVCFGFDIELLIDGLAIFEILFFEIFNILLISLSLYILITCVNKKQKESINVSKAVALILSIILFSFSWTYRKDIGIYAYFIKNVKNYEKIIPEITAAGYGYKGEGRNFVYRKQTANKEAVSVDTGPPLRLAFSYPGGILGNWCAAVYDKSGEVMIINDKSRRHEMKGLFGGDMTVCRPLEKYWYYCCFT